MPFKDNNLPSQSMPWGREVQKRIEVLESNLNSSEVNNAARDNQLSKALKRLDAAVTSLTTKIGSVGSINFTGTQTFTPAVATSQAVVARAYTGQTANIQEWQGNTGTVLSRVASDGTIYGTLSTPVIKNGLREVSYLSATGFAGYTYYWLTNGGIQYITANSTANGTVNITGSSTQTLNSLLNVGDTIVLTLELTNGASAFFPNAWQIDGTAITPKYQGGTVIASGNINSIDVYKITITKTAATPTYILLLSQTKFA